MALPFFRPPGPSRYSVRALELRIVPDISGGRARASLAQLRLAYLSDLLRPLVQGGIA